MSLVKAYKQCSMLLRKMMPQHRLLSSSCSSLAGHVPIVAFEDIPGSGFRRGDDFVDPAFSVASSRPRWISKSQMNQEPKFFALIRTGWLSLMLFRRFRPRRRRYDEADLGPLRPADHVLRPPALLDPPLWFLDPLTSFLGPLDQPMMMVEHREAQVLPLSQRPRRRGRLDKLATSAICTK